MTITTNSSGLLSNHTRRFDAVEYKTPYVSVINDDQFTDDNCVVCYNQANTNMMEVGPIPSGELSGLYNIRAYWNSSEFDAKDLKIHIYEDDVLRETTEFYGGGDYLTVGSGVISLFYPTHSYRIVVSSGSDSGVSVVKLDYIQLDQIYSSGEIASRLYVYGDSGPSIEVTDRGTATVTGTGTATADTVVSFNVTYSTPPQVELTSNSHLHNPSWHTKTNSGVTIRIVDMNLGTFSDTILVDWVARGSVLPPFKPGLTDYGTP